MVKRSKPKRQNAGAADNHRKAMILSHAATLGVCSAAKEFGVDRKSVQRYKAEHESGANPELSRLVAKETETARERSRSKLQKALDAVLERTIELAPKMTASEAINGVKEIGSLATARTVMGVESDSDGQTASGDEGLGGPTASGSTSEVAQVH